VQISAAKPTCPGYFPLTSSVNDIKTANPLQYCQFNSVRRRRKSSALPPSPVEAKPPLKSSSLLTEGSGFSMAFWCRSQEVTALQITY
jgi:hypothetical protein